MDNSWVNHVNKNRDTLYKCMKQLTSNTVLFSNIKQHLKVYNKILMHSILEAKL